MAAKHPLLGVGPGNWPVFYPAYMSQGDPSFDPDDIIPTNPWPSSDWMAIVSERGFVALALLALVGGSIALGAWARLRRGPPETPALADLTIVATLLAVAVVGAFDAVLLLPVPTLVRVDAHRYAGLVRAPDAARSRSPAAPAAAS